MPVRDMRFEASAPIHASPAVVWDILTDYRQGHAKIIPPDVFSDFRVEAGGRGAGTTIAYTFHAAGVTRAMRHIVSEPTPGQTLMESDADGSSHTTFALAPLSDGSQTLLTITTVERGHSGVRGVVERLLGPLLAPTMRRIYLDEMRRLDALAQHWTVAGGAANTAVVRGDDSAASAT